jgi:hypothetical protein
VRLSANLYPWDVDGDPAAADRIAGLGLREVTLAAAYHSVRAVTPYHPRHRIVTREAAAYYRTDPARWRSSRLRPVQAEPAGSFERAAGRLRAAGIKVTAWAVVTHNSRLGAANPSCAVENAYGDIYPWALCVASPAVREYAVALAAEVAGLADADAIELEACGWYGIDHGSAHDKTPGVAGPEVRWLLSACFCEACRAAYAAAGADPGELRAGVRSAADQILAGRVVAPAASCADRGALAGDPGTPDGDPGALPGDMAGVLLTVRATLARQFLCEVIAAVRAAAPGRPVLVHAHPDPREAGANPGYDLALVCGPGNPAGADGIVLACWNPGAAAALVARASAAAPQGTRIAASLLAVAGLGGQPGTLHDQAEAVRAVGATDLRLYHAGLASVTDADAIRAVSRRYPVIAQGDPASKIREQHVGVDLAESMQEIKEPDQP